MAESDSLSCGPVLGLDFGTSTTCAAVLRGGRLEIIRDTYNQEDITPSCVLFGQNSFMGRNRDSILVGEMAKQLENHHNRSVIMEMKRFLGKSSDDPTLACDKHFYQHDIVHNRNKQVLLKSYGGVFSPVEASSVFLKEIKLNAEKQLGCKIQQAVVTVPSSYGFRQCQALKEACSMAGITVAGLINEATAVSLAHGRISQSSNSKQLVLVICIGAAFVSLSLVYVKHGRSYKVKAVSGISDLGGNNFDIRVMNYIIAQIKTLTGKDVSLSGKLMMADLRKGVNTLKKNLTEYEKTTINIPLESGSIDISLTRADFERLNSNLFIALSEQVEKVLDDAKLRKEEIDDVILAGGSCRVPCIQKLFVDCFEGKSLSFSFKDCVTQAAVGAAMLGANLLGYEDRAIRELVQVAPYSIGIEISGKNFGEIIRKNSEVPQCSTRTYSTYNNYQGKALISVYEGDRAYAKGNVCLGQVILKNIHEEPCGFPEIDVTIELCQNHEITVKAVDVHSQQLGIFFKVSKATLLERRYQDESKLMALIAIERVPTDGRVPDAFQDWGNVEDDVLSENVIRKKEIIDESRCSDSTLNFKPLIKPPSRKNFLLSLTRSRQKDSQVQAQTSKHPRTVSEPNIANEKSAFKDVDEHQINLQHALSVANSALRRAEIVKENAIRRAEEAEMRAARLDTALECIKELEEHNDVIKANLEIAREEVGLYHSKYSETLQALKEKEAAIVDSKLLWVIQKDEIKIIADEELGRGGWGIVHKAIFRGTAVAAKRMYKHIISDYNRELFEREMSIAARIRHPNLLQFIGATAQEAEEPIILTELMSTTVWDELQVRSLSQQETISISLDVARALNYLHLMRPDPIIHRDVSSANVLLSPGNNGAWITKLSDYGSANYVQNAVTQGPGNAAYAAPDIVQTPAMDVYSFGVLLLEMYARRIPDNRATETEREALICKVTSPLSQNIVRLCTTVDAASRPTMLEIIQTLYI